LKFDQHCTCFVLTHLAKTGFHSSTCPYAR
jgi:hypothetical protein